MFWILIESGSTKLDCIIMKDELEIKRFTCSGINPTTMTDENILATIENIHSHTTDIISRIIFYGSGMRSEHTIKMNKLFYKFFPNALIELYSDLLAAVRATAQGEPSIVCILGTGSNSCITNGHNIVHQKISLGYLLGDEGSANDIGKKILIAYYYNNIRSDLKQLLESDVPNLTSNFLSDLYQSESKASLLGEIGRFAIQNKEHPDVQDIILLCIQSFYNKRLSYYSAQAEFPVYFIGSVAHHLKDEIRKVIQPFGFENIYFSQKPVDDLLKYHCKFLDSFSD